MDQSKPIIPENAEIFTKLKLYEREFVKSLSNIVKNVSEFFLPNGSSSTKGNDDINYAVSQPYSSQPPPSSQPLSATNSSTTSPLLFYEKSAIAPSNDNNISSLSLDEDETTSTINQFITNATSPLEITPYSPNNSFYYGLSWDDVVAQLILLITITFCLWLINRHILKWSSLKTTTEIILSWTLVILTLPISLLIFTPIFIGRAFVALYLKFISSIGSSSSGRTFLADPFESVWSFEQPHSPSTCVGFYIIEGDGDLERIRHLLYTRVMLREVNGVLVNDCFRWRLKTVCGFIAWERLEQFDIKNHIKYMAERSVVKERQDPSQYWTESDVFEELENLHETSLIDLESTCPSTTGQKLSPWEILIIPKLDYKNGEAGKPYYGIIFRIHHALMDGISMGHLLHDCIGDKPFKFSLDPIAPLKVSKLTLFIGNLISIICFPSITLRNLFFFEKNEFHGKTLTGPKKFTWSRPLKLDTLKQLKNITKSSVFSVLLSAIGGSMKKLYAKRGDGVVPKVIHACPPIAILPYPNRYPRNRFSIVLYPVVLGTKTVLERLNQVYKESKSLASSPDVLSNYYVVYILGCLPYSILKLLAPLAHATFTFSNIPGPADSVQVLNGDKLMEIGAWIPVKNRIGIGMALFSYQDRLRVTFIGDKAALAQDDDIQFLCTEFENEINELAMSLEVKCDKLFIE